jgi:four helix bundle protein
MASKGFEHLRIYGLAENLSDQVWELVIQWDDFARMTIGGQLARAADSIGANIAEGTTPSTLKLWVQMA